MPEIDAEIAAYSAMQRELEEKYMGKWILFYHGQLIAVYKSFDDAAKDAVARFGRGPYLIRQVGAPAVTLPSKFANWALCLCHIGVLGMEIQLRRQ